MENMNGDEQVQVRTMVASILIFAVPRVFINCSRAQECK